MQPPLLHFPLARLLLTTIISSALLLLLLQGEHIGCDVAFAARIVISDRSSGGTSIYATAEEDANVSTTITAATQATAATAEEEQQDQHPSSLPVAAAAEPVASEMINDFDDGGAEEKGEPIKVEAFKQCVASIEGSGVGPGTPSPPSPKSQKEHDSVPPCLDALNPLRNTEWRVRWKSEDERVDNAIAISDAFLDLENFVIQALIQGGHGDSLDERQKGSSGQNEEEVGGEEPTITDDTATIISVASPIASFDQQAAGQGRRLLAQESLVSMLAHLRAIYHPSQSSDGGEDGGELWRLHEVAKYLAWNLGYVDWQWGLDETMEERLRQAWARLKPVKEAMRQKLEGEEDEGRNEESPNNAGQQVAP